MTNDTTPTTDRPRCPFCGRLVPTLTDMLRDATGRANIDDFCDCLEAEKAAEEAEKRRNDEKAARNAEKKRAAIRARIEASGLPTALLEAKMSLFEQDTPQRRKAYAEAIAFAKGITGRDMFAPWLYIAGNVGTGKTFLAACLAADLMRRGVKVLWTRAADMLQAIRQTYNPGARESDADVMARYAGAELIVIDDLGKEKPTDWATERIYNLLDYRYNRNLPVLITSNYGARDLRQRMTPPEDDGMTAEAIVDRIRERCRLAILDGSSRRRSIGASLRQG